MFVATVADKLASPVVIELLPPVFLDASLFPVTALASMLLPTFALLFDVVSLLLVVDVPELLLEPAPLPELVEEFPPDVPPGFGVGDGLGLDAGPGVGDGLGDG